jgi:hypothetical protein
MRRQILITLMAAASITAFSACGDDEPSGPQSITYTATLSGANEVPARTTTATGSATLTMTGTTVNYTVTGTGFTSPVTAGHIHIGAVGVNGPIIVPLTITAGATSTTGSGTFSVAAPLTNGTTTVSGDSMKVLLNLGTSYVNIHTSTFPGGEIRGQVIKK